MLVSNADEPEQLEGPGRSSWGALGYEGAGATIDISYPTKDSNLPMDVVKNDKEKDITEVTFSSSVIPLTPGATAEAEVHVRNDTEKESYFQFEF